MSSNPTGHHYFCALKINVIVDLNSILKRVILIAMIAETSRNRLNLPRHREFESHWIIPFSLLKNNVIVGLSAIIKVKIHRTVIAEWKPQGIGLIILDRHICSSPVILPPFFFKKNPLYS